MPKANTNDGQVKTEILKYMTTQFAVFDEEDIPKDAIVKAAGHKNENTKGFYRPFLQLKRDDGMIEASSKKGCFRLTEKGRLSIPRDIGPPKTNAEARERYLALLRESVKTTNKLEAFWAILEDGQSHPIDEILRSLGLKNINTKSYSQPRAAFVKMKLVEVEASGALRFTAKALPETAAEDGSGRN